MAATITGSALGGLLGLIIFFGISGLVLLVMMVKVMTEYERGVVFRLGRVLGRPKGPGLIILIPMVDRIQRVSLRTALQPLPWT